ncbi:hypothetical protein BDW22DRAFT_1448354 [Trametopsis cervina]|nr:hypothetical protein BDW22DRAFT_1448354 [Trametopsis cervina]
MSDISISSDPLESSSAESDAVHDHRRPLQLQLLPPSTEVKRLSFIQPQSTPSSPLSTSKCSTPSSTSSRANAYLAPSLDQYLALPVEPSEAPAAFSPGHENEVLPVSESAPVEHNEDHGKGQSSGQSGWARPISARKTPLNRLAHPLHHEQKETTCTASPSNSDRGPGPVWKLQEEIIDGLASVEKKTSELSGLVDSYRSQCDHQFERLFKNITTLQDDLKSINVSISSGQRKEESNRDRIKVVEQEVNTAKVTSESFAAELRSLVTRAQVSLQNRRLEFERALAVMPDTEASIRRELGKIRLIVSVLGARMGGIENRVKICEVEGEVHAQALEKTFIDLSSMQGELPSIRDAIGNMSSCPRSLDDVEQVDEREYAGGSSAK